MEAPARSCRDPPSTSESHPFTIAVLVGVANDDGLCARAARYLSWDGCQPQADRICARLLDAMPTPMRSDRRRRRSPLLRVCGETCRGLCAENVQQSAISVRRLTFGGYVIQPVLFFYDVHSPSGHLHSVYGRVSVLLLDFTCTLCRSHLCFPVGSRRTLALCRRSMLCALNETPGPEAWGGA
jgi:hypothetical protein